MHRLSDQSCLLAPNLCAIPTHRAFQARLTRDRRKAPVFRAGGETSSGPDSGEQISKGGNASRSSLETNAKGLWGAVGAVALGATIFIATRFGASPVSLRTLEQSAIDIDAALQSNRPTLVEFYANWCEVCRELAPSVYQVEREYKDKVNFVMLNIENRKWAPEIAEYRVGGVPHFVFLDSRGQAEAAAVGRLPQKVLEGNVRALSERKQLPFRGARGAVSSLASSGSTSGQVTTSDPRSHS